MNTQRCATPCSRPIATIYVMQGEIYSDMPYGQHGSAEFSVEVLLRNAADYLAF